MHGTIGIVETYPQPGSNAERVLHYVLTHPGSPTNSIITGLRMNPSVVRKCLANLAEHNKIVDVPKGKVHSWEPKGTLV